MLWFNMFINSFSLKATGHTKPGKVGDFFCPGFNEITLFLPKCKALVTLRVFCKSIFFTYNHTFSSIFMFLKFDPYRIWCSIFYSKLIDCIIFKIIVQHVPVCIVNGRGRCSSGERNDKILQAFLSLCS
jgi:hypothetical protein